jgi:hypothetical protein
MAKKLPKITDVDRAAGIYKVKHFRYPIDVVNYENKVKVPADARLTCSNCKRFEASDHINEHHTNKEGQLELFNTTQFKN